MKTIIEMTRELGGFAPTTKFLERFAEIVRADERERLTDAAMKAAEKSVDTAMALEREACAKVCEDLETSGDAEFYGHVFAYAIRARGNT